MADTFCLYPFRQLQIETGGRVKVCCVDPGADDETSSVYRRSMDEIWNSDRLRGMRRAMANGEHVPDCASCHETERTAGWSMRSLMNARLPKYAKQQLITKSRATDFVLAETPTRLLLETGNTCNLKCRMCHGLSSSAIAADPVHATWTNVEVPALPEDRRIPAPWYRQESFLSEELLRDVSSLRELHVIGGETFLSKGGKLALRTLVDRGAAPNIAITLNTNGTIVDEEWLDLLGKFQSSVIAVSIDGVGPINDYIRYPSRLDEILANLPRFRAVPRALTICSATFQANNALRFTELLVMCDELQLPVYCYPLQSPKFLAPNALPPNARALAAERLRAYFKARRSILSQTGVGGLVPLLEQDDGVWDRALAQDFMEFCNDLDQARGQKLADVEPELLELFAAAGMPWVETTRHVQLAKKKRLAQVE